MEGRSQYPWYRVPMVSTSWRVLGIDQRLDKASALGKANLNSTT
jgi:hypothetical protein